MQVSITIRDNISPALWQLGADMPPVMDRILWDLAEEYTAFIQGGYLSGQLLAARTGETRRSIRAKRIKGYARGAWLVGSALNYTGIFETGGTIRPRPAPARVTRRTRAARQVLRFEVGGQTVFAREVTIPARPFMTASIEDWLARNVIEARAAERIDQEIRQRIGAAGANDNTI